MNVFLKQYSKKIDRKEDNTVHSYNKYYIKNISDSNNFNENFCKYTTVCNNNRRILLEKIGNITNDTITVNDFYIINDNIFIRHNIKIKSNEGYQYVLQFDKEFNFYKNDIEGGYTYNIDKEPIKQ